MTPPINFSNDRQKNDAQRPQTNYTLESNNRFQYIFLQVNHSIVWSTPRVIVCLCTGINEQQLRDVIAAGSKSVKDVAKKCGAGADCGSCVSHIRRLLHEGSHVVPGHGLPA